MMPIKEWKFWDWFLWIGGILSIIFGIIKLILSYTMKNAFYGAPSTSYMDMIYLNNNIQSGWTTLIIGIILIIVAFKKK
ncbi:hypothetical protein K8R47_01990 [archaeon]|nr:hypothetical protein [archaeon]